MANEDLTECLDFESPGYTVNENVELSYAQTNIKKPKTADDRIAFPIEAIPKSFKNFIKKEKDIIKLMIKKKGFVFKDCFNKNLKLEIDCYLKNDSYELIEIINWTYWLLEGFAFKDRKQIKELKIFVKDVKKDPFNSDGQPFIGIVVKTLKKFNKQEFIKRKNEFEKTVRQQMGQ